jgi:hypothetical protein
MQDISERLRTALASGDPSLLEPLFADGARFGSCVGAAQISDHLAHALGNAVAAKLAQLEVHGDRLIARVEVGRPVPQTLFAVFFVENDRIAELQVMEERDQALAVVSNPAPAPRPQTRTTLTSMAAVLPVRELATALDHYAALGFSVRSYQGGGYGFAERDGVNLHLAVVRDLDPAATTSAVYLYVADADLLFAEWRSSGVSGQFVEPKDTEYGLREGAHIDRDGNLLRFGSKLPERASNAAPAA